MSGTPKTDLLFGPYRPPCLKRGDRAFCLYRDDLVVITGWSDAPIPWPLCRRLDPPGGVGLFIDDELARAVSHEAALVVAHWWGVERSAVGRWRKALGIGRMDSEGSRRLILGCVQSALSTHYAGKLPRRKRRPAPVAGVEPADDLGLLWMPEEVALVGVLSDAEVGRRIGRSRNAVRIKREQLRRPDPTDRDGKRKHRPWTDEEDHLVRTLPPAEAAAGIGRTRGAVYTRRYELGATEREPTR